MSGPVLVDTDVLIDFLRGYGPAESFINVHSERIILSAIVVAELYAGAKGAKDGTEQTMLEDLLSLFRIVPIGSDVARLGGLYRRDYGPSHGVSLPDGLVAATALLEGAELKTLNIRHYPMFEGIEPAYRK